MHDDAQADAMYGDNERDIETSLEKFFAKVREHDFPMVTPAIKALGGVLRRSEQDSWSV